MTNLPTLGARLSDLRVRSGLSLQATALLAGYRNGSSIQRYFDDAYNPPHLPLSIARKLVPAFEGKGDPPIEEQEIIALTGISKDYLSQIREVNKPAEDHFSVILTDWDFDRQYAPDWASFRAPFIVGQRLYKVPRPDHLKGLGGLAYVVTNELMAPRYNVGEIIVTVSKLPPKIGDYVVVSGQGPDSDFGERGGVVYGRIGRLLHRGDDFLELEQYNPAERFRIPREQIAAMHRILDPAALLGWRD